MTDELYVGIDLGTQSVKVGAYDRSGMVQAGASRALTSRRDGRVHEQDPRQWISATSQALAETIGALASGCRASIAGVAICGTSGACE